MEVYRADFSTSVGPSMRPTLKSGDTFVLKQIDLQKELRAGDIVVYPHPEAPVNVIHRVIKITPAGVRTRGDNNNKTDPYIVKLENIKGIVTSVKRGNREIPLAGGTRGLIRHKLMLAGKYLIPPLLYPLTLISKLLTASRIFNFVHPFLKIKIIVVRRNGHEEEIIRFRNRAVGKRLSKNDPWRINFPYKLFIDQRKLK